MVPLQISLPLQILHLKFGDKINHLDGTKSPGYDLIILRILYELPRTRVIQIITTIFNSILQLTDDAVEIFTNYFNLETWQITCVVSSYCQ